MDDSVVVSITPLSSIIPPKPVPPDPPVALNKYLERKTIPKTVHCMHMAIKSRIKMTRRFIVDTLVLARKSLRRPGTIQTAFIIRIARARSNLGRTRKTKMDTPKL